MTGDDVGQALAEFWCDLLEVEKVGPGDGLLALGGNSLVATMLANRIELAWGFRPTQEVIMTATFGELVERCRLERAR